MNNIFIVQILVLQRLIHVYNLIFDLYLTISEVSKFHVTRLHMIWHPQQHVCG